MPAYRFHLSGQAVVTLAGKDFYLGPHDSPESRARYFQLVQEYNANGKVAPDTPTRQKDQPVTVRTVVGEYREWIRERYANSYKERKRHEGICTTLEDEYGDLPADDFGPRKLAELRDLFIASGNSRTYVNRLVRQVKGVFRHAVSRELVGVNLVIRLDTLEPLRRGQTRAKEPERVKPVDLGIVRATAKHLSPILKAMIELQTATGMRPSEVCNLRPCDIERRQDGVWLYRPHRHKTQYRGKDRVVPIVGDLRITLGPFLDRDPEAFCFSPRESMAWFREQQRLNRKTKVQPSQASRAKANPKRQPGPKYLPDSYHRAVKMAAKKAKADHWFPYQLRHTAASVVREALGVEAAQALLGHSRVDMTEHYARLSEAKAIEAAKVAPTIG
jgi:integrase